MTKVKKKKRELSDGMNILALLEEKNITTRRVSGNKGGEYHSSCPGCGGDDRFHTWPAQNNGRGSWWCRKCGKGGDAIQFLREFSGMSFKDACSRLGIKKTAGNYRRSWKAAPVPPRQPAKKELEPRPEGSVLAPWSSRRKNCCSPRKWPFMLPPLPWNTWPKAGGSPRKRPVAFVLACCLFLVGKIADSAAGKNGGFHQKTQVKNRMRCGSRAACSFPALMLPVKS